MHKRTRNDVALNEKKTEIYIHRNAPSLSPQSKPQVEAAVISRAAPVHAHFDHAARHPQLMRPHKDYYFAVGGVFTGRHLYI